MERVILQFQDEIMNLVGNKGEGKKPFKKKISTNTSPKVPPILGINLEDYDMDNFCHTHCAYHFEKTCLEFINSLKEMLLPPKTLEKENKSVDEENHEAKKGEAKKLKYFCGDPTTIASTPMEKSTDEILKKDKENEKDSNINHTVNDSSNLDKLVILLTLSFIIPSSKHSLVGQMLNSLLSQIHTSNLNSFIALRLLILIVH